MPAFLKVTVPFGDTCRKALPFRGSVQDAAALSKAPDHRVPACAMRHAAEYFMQAWRPPGMQLADHAPPAGGSHLTARVKSELVHAPVLMSAAAALNSSILGHTQRLEGLDNKRPHLHLPGAKQRCSQVPPSPVVPVQNFALCRLEPSTGPPDGQAVPCGPAKHGSLSACIE